MIGVVVDPPTISVRLLFADEAKIAVMSPVRGRPAGHINPPTCIVRRAPRFTKYFGLRK